MNTILGTKKDNYSGDMVLNNQEIATKQGFDHVSKIWYDQTMSFDDGLQKLAEQQDVIQDVLAPLRDWRPVVTSVDCFALEYVGNNPNMEQGYYFPNERSMYHLSSYSNMSGFACWSLTQPQHHRSSVDSSGEPKVLWHRDRGDAELLKRYFDTHLFNPQRIKQDIPRFWRTWKNDRSMRAFASDKYAVVNNEWFLRVLKGLIPGGRLSHWRGDADSIWGNVLIPDTIRTERDSDYGGMLSVGNSEVKERRLYTQPSVFRAICMNGCIWDQESGNAINIRHIGNIDLNELRDKIRHNLESQIPLIEEGIQRVLGIRAYGCGDINTATVIAQVCQDESFSPKHGRGILNAFLQERSILDKEADTLFGIQGAITRWGQTEDNATWYRADCVAGNLVNFSKNNWERLCTRAKNLTISQVEKIFGLAV